MALVTVASSSGASLMSLQSSTLLQAKIVRPGRKALSTHSEATSTTPWPQRPADTVNLKLGTSSSFPWISHFRTAGGTLSFFSPTSVSPCRAESPYYFHWWNFEVFNLVITIGIVSPVHEQGYFWFQVQLPPGSCDITNDREQQMLSLTWRCTNSAFGRKFFEPPYFSRNFTSSVLKV